jgi:hypothetical protein
MSHLQSQIALERLRRVAGNFVSIYDFERNPLNILAAHETAGMVDGSMATKMTVQYNLFGGTVFRLGTQRHRKVCFFFFVFFFTRQSAKECASLSCWSELCQSVSELYFFRSLSPNRPNQQFVDGIDNLSVIGCCEWASLSRWSELCQSVSELYLFHSLPPDRPNQQLA